MYEPAEDSYLLKEQIELFCKNKNPDIVLDMGSGSGIQAFAIANIVKKVIAVDINRDSCNHIKKEIIAKGLSDKIVVLCSDLFLDVPSRFKRSCDLIIFNAPYLPKGEDDYEDEELYGGPEGIKVTKDFLLGAKEFLSGKGEILFVASSLSKINVLEGHMKNLNYQFEIISKKHISFEDILIYRAWL